MQVVAVGRVRVGRTSLIPIVVLCPDAFEIRRLSSTFLRVRTNVGVRVLYDRQGLRLYLQVDQRWAEDTVGLCGTFNGNTQDDFLYVPLPRKQKGGGSLKAEYLEALIENISCKLLVSHWATHAPLIIDSSPFKSKHISLRPWLTVFSVQKTHLGSLLKC